ncbi:hypothetical protein JTB14_012285 [Gonioctena quinquepunctata]|nr:hypothetical protein JTB14_012285 [Gonioctena quinquepunctata]
MIMITTQQRQPDNCMLEENGISSVQKKVLKEIKIWLHKERSNLHARVEDKYLLTFLRTCNFNLDETKTKIVNYYTMRRDVEVWYRNRDPRLEEIQELVKLGVFVPLKVLYKRNLVVIIRTAAHDPDKHTQDNVFKTGQMLLDVAALLEHKCSEIDGIISIFDMKGVTFWHGKLLTPKIVKRAVFGWMNYHFTTNLMEYINTPLYLNLILHLFKRFMSAELKKKVRVHSSMDSFHKVIDKNILPMEYGGNGESIEDLIDYWNEKLLSYRDWLLEDEQYRAE